MKRTGLLTLGALLAVAGCGRDEVATPRPTLSPSQQLTRVSMDLRGVRPSLEELDAIERDPARLDAFADEYLQDERFSRRVEDLYAEVLHIRTGDWFVYLAAYGFEQNGGLSGAEIVANAADEPLRMLSYLAENDRSYDEWVTGDWTMTNPTLQQVWPVEPLDGASADGSGWQTAHYTDGRPGVGALATNGLWWFQGSMENNRNRGRANLVARVFLCSDYLEREVPFVSSDVLSSDDAVGDAIRTNPGCVACHETLDPLASHFYGFWWYFLDKGLPEQVEVYHPEREYLWRDLTGVAPAYYGQSSTGLVDLGRFVSADPRYSTCLVQNLWEGTTRTDVDDVPVDLSGLEVAFEGSGRRLRSVFRAMVKHPAYLGDDSRFTLRLATPDQLSSMVEDLTGYRWDYQGYDLTTGATGFVLLAGGSDGDKVATSSPTPTVSSVLVQQRLAENAGTHVVLHDMGTTERTLFDPELTFEETPTGEGRAQMQTQLVHLERRILGHVVEPDGPEVEALLVLWQDLYDLSGQDAWVAWSGVVTTLLRDPDLVMY